MVRLDVNIQAPDSVSPPPQQILNGAVEKLNESTAPPFDRRELLGRIRAEIFEAKISLLSSVSSFLNGIITLRMNAALRSAQEVYVARKEDNAEYLRVHPKLESSLPKAESDIIDLIDLERRKLLERGGVLEQSVNLENRLHRAQILGIISGQQYFEVIEKLHFSDNKNFGSILSLENSLKDLKAELSELNQAIAPSLKRSMAKDLVERLESSCRAEKLQEQNSSWSRGLESVRQILYEEMPKNIRGIEARSAAADIIVYGVFNQQVPGYGNFPLSIDSLLNGIQNGTGRTHNLKVMHATAEALYRLGLLAKCPSFPEGHYTLAQAFSKVAGGKFSDSILFCLRSYWNGKINTGTTVLTGRDELRKRFLLEIANAETTLREFVDNRDKLKAGYLRQLEIARWIRSPESKDIEKWPPFIQEIFRENQPKLSIGKSNTSVAEGAMKSFCIERFKQRLSARVSTFIEHIQGQFLKLFSSWDNLIALSEMSYFMEGAEECRAAAKSLPSILDKEQFKGPSATNSLIVTTLESGRIPEVANIFEGLRRYLALTQGNGDEVGNDDVLSKTYIFSEGAGLCEEPVSHCFESLKLPLTNDDVGRVEASLDKIFEVSAALNDIDLRKLSGHKDFLEQLEVEFRERFSISDGDFSFVSLRGKLLLRVDSTVCPKVPKLRQFLREKVNGTGFQEVKIEIIDVNEAAIKFIESLSDKIHYNDGFCKIHFSPFNCRSEIEYGVEGRPVISMFGNDHILGYGDGSSVPGAVEIYYFAPSESPYLNQHNASLVKRCENLIGPTKLINVIDSDQALLLEISGKLSLRERRKLSEAFAGSSRPIAFIVKH